MSRRAVPAVVLMPLLVVALVISGSACGTLSNFARRPNPETGEARGPVIGGGVANDLAGIAGGDSAELPFPPGVLIIDLPFTIAGDVLTLPLVLLRQMINELRPPARVKSSGSSSDDSARPDAQSNR